MLWSAHLLLPSLGSHGAEVSKKMALRPRELENNFNQNTGWKGEVGILHPSYLGQTKLLFSYARKFTMEK